MKHFSALSSALNSPSPSTNFTGLQVPSRARTSRKGLPSLPPSMSGGSLEEGSSGGTRAGEASMAEDATGLDLPLVSGSGGDGDCG
eukprot:CAMPEP_0119495064 /NCGR_PEP_ID=MMETSP1344-20130328/18821_1 /TAXON_ID=236787 /ORGANISM="Florenciella parvula, Strain CCMP2471" /LENGTH=85 /DNA_ID=CAMNT_0007530623 /DNA_START=131 /DNA_END=385 /DNA_ORIENTATION=-